ncbi:hypothetical protein COY07_02655 [Candidatus Peregrinibacteria bacterium CG_4_10_14_0_2_um_filter_43_11]|nr:MAG: hypothetical protein COY07_02655 [Candidatus Peregrinibacteria bacterium CG_4_10_14_0_2_um_filter_43_11]
MSFELLAVISLVFLAIGDLIVGVVNDAVNFLNSALGAKVTSRKVIMIVASIGIIIGTTFSDGIIEVTRKGIFYPEHFSLNEAILIFTAVSIADIILLDLYSTFGLPTSTTVSVVFELLGAAFVLAWLKMGNSEKAWEVINSASAIKIIMGILLSIAVAFSVGLIAQFISRMLFTFNYKPRLQRWGFLWCGIALTAMVFFIILKGGNHATFMTPEIKTWISNSTSIILGGCFVFFTILSYVLIKCRVNILKIIVLIGTGSLAMAFAGNDLANFIGVSVGGVHAFLGSDLSGTLRTPTSVVALAGIIMAIAIFVSKKSQTVNDTEINLSSHNKEVMQHWKSNVFVAKLSETLFVVYKAFLFFIPGFIKKWVALRWHRQKDEEGAPAFDLIRASVNLMVAAAVISYATSQKLPLSTTYVTFMVAMGTSLADRAWGRDCAPCRINGIITVIGSWFVTAILAFLMAGITVTVLYSFRTYGLIFLLLMIILIVYKLNHVHDKRSHKQPSVG